MPDIFATSHGSLWVLEGETEAGRDWLDENLDPEAMRFGRGIVVEPRYVEPILQGALDDGLGVAC